ncbi:DNA repair-scaffolding protein isoform X3 [Pseudophryne corroboree]|uniref:DNA repair-scaffolding protein isoform X3 n=1 Tax=Pseudophryne corroboree TaxID=495146 RepID=UPI0030812699
MPQGKRKRSADKTQPFFPDNSNNDAKKSTAEATLKPVSLSKAWMRCSEGFDGCRVQKVFRSCERKPQAVRHLAKSFVFDEETSADESLKDPADIVWSSSDHDLSDVGSEGSNSQPVIAELSPENGQRSQDIAMSSSTQGCSGSDVLHITDWQDDSDIECDREKCSVSEAAESVVEISDSESLSSDLLVSQQQSETEPAKAIDIVEYLSDDPPDEPTLPAARQDISVGGENVIPSSGKSASNWLKTAQILLQTPEKKLNKNFKTPDDSAKKRKRFLRGGLAERLNRLQNRERSAITFWRHQCESDCKIPLGDKSGTLMIKIIEVHEECSVQVAVYQPVTGVQSDGDFSASLPKDVKLMVLFTRQTAAQLKLGPNDIIVIYPPWQRVTLHDQNVSVILNTHFSQKIIFNSSEGTENKLCSSSTMSVIKRMVPLSLEFKMNIGGLSCELECEGQQKVSSYCVTNQSPVSDRGKKITSSVIINDSLLDVVETQRAAGGKVCIRVVVQRVYYLTARDGPDCLLRRSTKTISDPSANLDKPEVRMCLLIQDAYGIFSELHVQFASTPVDDIRIFCETLEGKACLLSGMKILQRTTRGRAPGLFSLIDSLWPPLVPIKIHGHSQEQGQVVLANLPAPSFCYVLAVSHEEGDNNIKAEDAMSELYLPPVIHSLEEILQVIVANQRRSFWAQVIYMRPEIPSKQKEFWLYVTDTTLQNAPAPSGFPRVILVCVLPTCVLDHRVVEALSKRSPCTIFFKDAVIENERIICVERTVLSLQKPLLSCASGINELTGPVRLDELDSATGVNSLCTVKGTVIGVNERESFSWPVCNLCGSNKLQPLDSDRHSFFCRQCALNVSSPVIRMQLEVFLRCELRPECKVRLQLQQETVSSVLGSCSSEDGRYEVRSVLGKEVGPLHCYVQCVNTNVELEEICLLQAGTSGTQAGLDFAM